MSLVPLPAAAFGLLAIGQKFLLTERVAARVSRPPACSRKRCVRFSFCGLFACSSPPPPNWPWPMGGYGVDPDRRHEVHLVVGLRERFSMFLMRHFAGPLAHKSLAGGSCKVGDFLSAGFDRPAVAQHRELPNHRFARRHGSGIGVCYMWPTLLAAASERFSRRSAVDGPDGHGRHVVDPVCAAADGQDF